MTRTARNQTDSLDPNKLSTQEAAALAQTEKLAAADDPPRAPSGRNLTKEELDEYNRANSGQPTPGESPPAARVENKPSINYPASQPQVLKPIPLTPAQAEYKRVYPKTVYPTEFTPVDPVKVSPPVELGRLAGLKAKVDEALAGADLTGAQRRKLDEVFGTAAKEEN